jgi:peptide/nickel transport system permease protein
MLPSAGQLPDTGETSGTVANVSTPTAVPLAALPVAGQRRLHVPQFLKLLLRNKMSLFGLCVLTAIVLIALFSPWIERTDPNTMDFTVIAQPPSWAHPFGTTQQGNDVFSQVVRGARTSLLIGSSAAALATLIAAAVGMTGAYVGGLVDELLNLITNIFLVLPGLPVLIVISAYLPFKGGSAMVLLIALLSWSGEARVLRSFALTLRSRDFVLAAKTSGESLNRIIFREIMPNMTSRIVAGFLYSFVAAIGFEAALEFLGFGGGNGVSWGITLFWAGNNAALETGAWWHFFFPGMALALTGTALIFINYGVDEISNPRLQGVKMPKKRKRGRTKSSREVTSAVVSGGRA